MSTIGAVLYPDKPARDSQVIAAVGFPEGLGKAAWVFSLFLLIFPPVAVIGTYTTDGVVLLSLPLLLMGVCGAFGVRLSIHLRSTK